MYRSKNTTADEYLVLPRSNGVNLRSLIVSADSDDNTLFLKNAIGGNILYKQKVVAGDNRGFITNFPVVRSLDGIVVALASATAVDIYYDY
jgi:hypothetical protein